MYKILGILILLALSASGAAAQIDEKPYIDTIVSVYTDSVDFTIIETANWQYMYVENIKEVLYYFGEDISEYKGSDILVKEIKQLNNKTVVAKIFVL